MKKKYLPIIGLIVIVVLLCLGEMGILSMGSQKANFHDDIASYEIKNCTKIEFDGQVYAIIKLECENTSNEAIAPWENSGYNVEQDGPSRVVPLERVNVYNEKFADEDAFNRGIEKLEPNKKFEIELVYKVQFANSPIYIRGISDGNSFEYAMK